MKDGGEMDRRFLRVRSAAGGGCYPEFFPEHGLQGRPLVISPELRTELQT